MMVIPERSGTAPAAEDDRAGGRGGWRWWRMGGVGWRRWRCRGFGYLVDGLVLACALLEMFLLFELLQLGFEYLVDGLVLTCALLEMFLLFELLQ